MTNLLSEYNSAETVLVLTSFPDNKRGDISAIDRYSLHKLTDIAKERKVVVLAQKYNNTSKNIFEYSKNFLIARSWRKENLFSILSLLTYIWKLPQAKTVLVEFEFNVFGGTIPNFLLLLVLFINRLFGKRVLFELHQVITDISRLEQHLNVHSPFLQKLYSIGIGIYYRLVGLVSDNVIVLEEELKKRLEKYVSPDKIIVLPHHMVNETRIDKVTARKTLGLPQDEFIVLVFGYLNWYKGADFIVQAAKKWKTKNIRLVVAGGPNPYHTEKKYYQTYFQSIVKAIDTQSQIIYTGFVKEADIKNYYSAADMAVLPYRVFMAASGPFSLGLTYGLPMILSEALYPYTKSGDFKEAMNQAKVTKKDLFIPLNEQDFTEAIMRVKVDIKYQIRLKQFSTTLAKVRSNYSVMSTFMNLFHNSEISVFNTRLHDRLLALKK